ncbi:MAG: hypothetical protein ACXVPQ_06240 [Bacteroidia bacterium]
MKKLLVIALAFSFSATFAQIGGGMAAAMTALQSGDVKTLDKVTKVNITYEYKDMGVGAFRSEEDYINKKYKDLEEKEKGKGDEFKANWEKGKTEKYPEHFEELFNKYGEKDLSMTGSRNNTSADCNLIVKTTFIEPGYNVGFSKKPAFIDVEFVFTDKSGKELVRFFVKNAVGSNMSGFDYDVSSRVKESYGKAAKMLVGGIKKERKKSS